MVYLIIARDQGKFILRVIWLLAFAGAFNLHHHLVLNLNGGSLGTSIVVHLNNSLENKSGTSCYLSLYVIQYQIYQKNLGNK
jgi:hypothetical protein